MDQLIIDTAERICRDHREQPEAVWQALEDNQLTQVWASGDDDSRLSLADGLSLLRIAAAHASGIPYAEKLLASHLLTAAGLSTPEGRGVAVYGGEINGDQLTGECNAVPFAAEADWLVCVVDQQVWLLNDSFSATPCSLPGEDPAANITINCRKPAASAASPSWLNSQAFSLFAGVIRSAQMCGAMEATLDLSVEFTAQREQFGRPLAKFQAIQHMLADMAGEVSAAVASLDEAAEQIQLSDDPVNALIPVAGANTRCREAAGIVATHAHQLHGAIGYTDEYALARYSGRLWRWREEYGNETYWSIILGEAITAPHAPSLTQQVFGA